MDKKKLLIGAGAAVISVLAIVLLLSGKAEAPAETLETSLAVVETEPTISAEETTEPAGFANEALEGEPAPFDADTAVIISDTEKETQTTQSGGNTGTSTSTKPSSGSTGTSTNKKPSSSSNTGSSGNSKPSSGSNTGTSGNNQPSSGGNTGTQETLPPEVDVNIGIEKDESLDGNLDNTESTTTKPTEAPQPTKPIQPSQPQGGSSSTINGVTFDTLTYENYNALSGDQQAEVIEWFASPEVFVRWYKAAEAQYKAEHPDIEIGGDGSIDAGDLKG